MLIENHFVYTSIRIEEYKSFLQPELLGYFLKHVLRNFNLGTDFFSEL